MHSPWFGSLKANVFHQGDLFFASCALLERNPWGRGAGEAWLEPPVCGTHGSEEGGLCFGAWEPEGRNQAGKARIHHLVTSSDRIRMPPDQYGQASGRGDGRQFGAVLHRRADNPPNASDLGDCELMSPQKKVSGD